MKINLYEYKSLQQLTALGISINDFYQLPDYVKLDSVLIEGEPCLLTGESQKINIAIPVIKRKVIMAGDISTIYFDLISPYGYPGILYNIPPVSDDLENFISALKVFSLENNLVSLFVRLNPIENNAAFSSLKNTIYFEHGKTVYIDLKNELSAIENNYSQNHKRGIKKLKNNGYSIRVNDWDLLPEFINAYNDTMKHVAASPYYHFNEVYFNSIKNLNGAEVNLFSAHNDQGILGAGALFIATGTTVQYHLGGTSPSYREQAPSKLIFDFAINHFRNNGKNILHLGGGLGSAEDALFRFKAGFSSERFQFSTIRLILDQNIYDRLVEDKNKKGAESASGFFPLYRS